VNPGQQPNYQEMLAQYEQRMNGLMSSMNRAQSETSAERTKREEAERLATEAAKAKNDVEVEFQRFRAEQKAQLDQVVETSRAIVAAANTRDAELKAAQAEMAKLRVISQNPHLSDLADLLPATTDEAVLAAKVAQLNAFVTKTSEQARQQLQAGYVSSSNPARGSVQPDGVTQTDLAAFAARMSAASAAHDEAAFEKAKQELINAQAQAVARTRAR
jgi:hypothetical protein